MFEGYQECVISSTSSHAKKITARGFVRQCRLVLKLLVRKQGNPLSIIQADLCTLTSAHIQYMVSCHFVVIHV